MKIAEIRNSESNELLEKVKELKSELLTLRFQKTSGQLENPTQIRQVRKDISRILTVIEENKRKGGKIGGKK